MLLLIFLILAGFILLGLMSKEFYTYRVREDSASVAKSTLGFGILYLILAVVSFVVAIAMLIDNNVQYTVTFSKLSKVQESAQ